MKQLSSALLLETPSGFLFCHPTSRNYSYNSWDLPKGHVEKGEDDLSAMIRELKEETGLNYDDLIEKAYYFKDCGLFPYNKVKNLHLYHIKINFTPPLENLECTSTYINSYNEETPEHNDFMYSWDLNYLYIRLKGVIGQAGITKSMS